MLSNEIIQKIETYVDLVFQEVDSKLREGKADPSVRVILKGVIIPLFINSVLYAKIHGDKSLLREGLSYQAIEKRLDSLLNVLSASQSILSPIELNKRIESSISEKLKKQASEIETIVDSKITSRLPSLDKKEVETWLQQHFTNFLTSCFHVYREYTFGYIDHSTNKDRYRALVIQWHFQQTFPSSPSGGFSPALPLASDNDIQVVRISGFRIREVYVHERGQILFAEMNDQWRVELNAIGEKFVADYEKRYKNEDALMLKRQGGAASNSPVVLALMLRLLDSNLKNK